ncbi:MAG TPA: transglutaminase domain-containing protein [Pyrinomonadaceae bacterium]|jgi:transglutaminase-like putative cysteine protease
MNFKLRFLLPIFFVFCVCFQPSALGQSAEQEARARVWNGYQLPASNFVRFVDTKQGYSLWRLADWKESAQDGVTFSAGEKWPQVRVFTTDVPDGYGAANFATAILQQWRKEPIRQETVVVRRVLVGGADGREFTFEVEDEPGHALRETVWLTAVGPRAYIFYFLTEPEEQERYEPYFKHMMLSLRIGAAGHWSEEFETLRARFADNALSKPGRETEAAQLAEGLRAGREPVEVVVGRLAELVREAPAATLDLLTDYDPQVRAASIAAIARSEDARMTEVLAWAISDKDGYASAVAARALAGRGAVGLAALKGKLTTLSREPGAVLRVATLLKEEGARELAQELLKSDESASQLAGLQLSLVLPLKGLVLPFQKLLASDNQDVALATVAALRSRRVTDAVPELLRLASGDTEHRAVRALGEIAPVEVGQRFKERVKEIDARLLSLKGAETERTPAGGANRKGNTARTQGTVAGQRAGKRNVAARSPLSDDELYESEATQYRELASAAWLPLREFKALPERVRLAVLRGELVVASEKIELRDRYMRAPDKSARQAVLEEALQRPGLIFWARLALQPIFEPGSVAFALDTSPLVDAPTTGETLFPQNATLYLVAPNFAGTLSKLDEALAGVQMEGVRDQMTFALILKSLKARLANAVGAEAIGDAGTAIGVDLKAPLSLAMWPASEAEADGFSRSAVVLRVTDRARFERMLMLYQNGIGGFYSFVAVASAGARFMEAMPALFPLALAGERLLPGVATGATGASSPRPRSPVYIRQEQLGQLSVTVFEKLNLYDSGAVAREPVYLAYLGSTAVLAPTHAALIDLLKAAEKRLSITENKAYARALAEEGEIKFFSQPSALLKDSQSGTKEGTDPVWQKLTGALGQETGALRLSSSTWETIFHLDFTDEELTRSLHHFKAQELSAPRELLPADTILYTGAKLEPSRLWSTLKGLGIVTARNSLDDAELEKRVTPKLQGEVSMALISLTTALDRTRSGGPSFLIALKLKDTELASLHRSGQLFTKAMPLPGVATLSSPVASVPDGAGRLYLAVTNDYLLMANEVEALKRLEAKEKLSATRDYRRSVSATTESSVALFATYSPDAAFKDIQSVAKDTSEQMGLVALGALAHAFHSQRAVVSVNGNLLEGKLAVSFDREGRFSVGEVARGAGEFDVANALITPKGLNISEPKRTAALRLRVSAKQPGVLARVRDDVAKFPWQKVESASDAALVFNVEARRIPEKQTIQLPVTNLAETAPYLRSSARIDRSAPQVVKLAREIAGDDRDGRSVAHKLGEWTFKNLTWKRVEGNTTETLASREADCLEHSELYVALARSLGLPARVVTGAAFSGGSFGAHAWVEIYLGRWVEVDPTWGMTDYVDSTHLRFDGDTFASYAMLNQLQLEVLEARSFVADYQRDPARLVKEWGASGEDATREFVFNFALTAEQALGPEALRKLTERQSAAVIQAFERAVASEAQDWSWGAAVRVLSSEVKDAQARLLVLRGDDLLRVRLALREGAWFITEIEDMDYGIPLFADALGGALRPGTSRCGLGLRFRLLRHARH